MSYELLAKEEDIHTYKETTALGVGTKCIDISRVTATIKQILMQVGYSTEKIGIFSRGGVMTENKIAIVSEQTLQEKIYTIRGKQVMLDFDLAEIYGYETSAFNQ